MSKMPHEIGAPMNSQVVVIGKKISPKEFELIGAGMPSYVVAATQVTAGVQRLFDAGQGAKVLADFETTERNGTRCSTATWVRELAVNPKDLRRFEEALAPYRRAGIGTLVPHPELHLRDVFSSLAAQGFPSWNPQAHLAQLFLRDKTCFPEVWWHDDPECGVDEMVALLENLKVKGRIPKEKILADAEADLDSSESEDEARDRLCAVLCATGNDLLRDEGHTRRFCGPFYAASNCDEPLWMFCEPDFFARLICERILVHWTGRRERPVHTYKRPPDIGELDLDKFPSGDEPF